MDRGGAPARARRGARHRLHDVTLRDALVAPLPPSQASRVKRQLALLPVYGWILFAWTSFFLDNSVSGTLDRSGHIKGHDFTHFYVLGQIGAQHATSDLYNYTEQSARLDAIDTRFRGRFLPVYPPQTAIALAPLGRLPYVTALDVWWGLSAVVYAACCYVFWRFEPRIRRLGWWTIVILAAGFAPLHSVIAQGQTSVFALAFFTLGWMALRSEQSFLAGLALGALAYKPSLALVFPLVFLASGNFLALAGVALSVGVQCAASVAWFGWQAVGDFAANAGALLTQVNLLEPQPWQMHSLRSFWSLLVPSQPMVAVAAYLVSAAAMLWLAVRAWRSTMPLDLRYAMLILVTVLVDPHVNSYDLIVVTCALFPIAARILDQASTDWRAVTLFAVLYFWPALETVTRFTHFQASVPALVAMTVWLGARSR